MIKVAIRVIIENLVPARLRVIFGLFRDRKRPSLEDIKKLFKLNPQRFYVEVKDPKFGQAEM